MKDFVSKEAALDAVRDLHIGLDLDLEAAMHIKRLLARSEEGNLLPKARRLWLHLHGTGRDQQQQGRKVVSRHDCKCTPRTADCTP